MHIQDGGGGNFTSSELQAQEVTSDCERQVITPWSPEITFFPRYRVKVMVFIAMHLPLTVFPEVWGRILIVTKKRQPGTFQGMFSDDKTGEIKIASAWPSEKIKSEILYISL